MKFTSAIKIIIGGGFLIWCQQSISANSASATIPVEVTFIDPPCSIVVPDTVSLGYMLTGTHSYDPVYITINCSSLKSSAIYAEIVQGTLTSGYTDRLNMIGPTGSSGSPVQFWLVDSDGKTISIDGSGITNPASQFCEGSETRQCSFTPLTMISTDTPRGQTQAILRFSIVYS
ncbi:fimbrial protein [Enterobacter roggenkampii]